MAFEPALSDSVGVACLQQSLRTIGNFGCSRSTISPRRPGLMDRTSSTGNPAPPSADRPPGTTGRSGRRRSLPCVPDRCRRHRRRRPQEPFSKPEFAWDWTSYLAASWATVSWPLTASRPTLALNAGLCFLRPWDISHSSLAATAALSLGAGPSLSHLSSFPGPPQ